MPNQLESEIDACIVVAEIVLLRAASDRTILLVEGWTDERLISAFVDMDACDIVNARGHDTATYVLYELKTKAISGIICILDRDFGDFLNNLPEGPEIVFTDDHDLETMLIRSRAFDRILLELGSRSKLKEIREAGQDHRELIRDAAHDIGLLRFLSLSDKLNLKFDGLRYRFIDRRTLAVDLGSMIQEVFNHSCRRCTNEDVIKTFIACWKCKPHATWRMVCGHDLTAILAKALQSRFGTNNANSVPALEIERKLRLAYSAEDFRQTGLFQEICVWEQNNAPYRCLSEEIRSK